MDFWSAITNFKVREDFIWERMKRNHPRLTREDEIMTRWKAYSDSFYQALQFAQANQQEYSSEWKQSILNRCREAIEELLKIEHNIDEFRASGNSTS